MGIERVTDKFWALLLPGMKGQSVHVAGEDGTPWRLEGTSVLRGKAILSRGETSRKVPASKVLSLNNLTSSTKER